MTTAGIPQLRHADVCFLQKISYQSYYFSACDVLGVYSEKSSASMLIPDLSDSLLRLPSVSLITGLASVGVSENLTFGCSDAALFKRTELWHHALS